jgi:hypothetical protein
MGRAANLDQRLPAEFAIIFVEGARGANTADAGQADDDATLISTGRPRLLSAPPNSVSV